MVAARGDSIPKQFIKHDDHTELVKPGPANPDNASPVDQIVVRDTKGEEHHIRLFPGMVVEHLREKLNAIDIEPGSRQYLHAGDGESYSHYVSLLEQQQPESPVQDAGITAPGTHKVQGRWNLSFSGPDYWRSIAKIAFHYYLAVSKRGLRGDEPEFAGIRSFILNGGDYKRFFRANKVGFKLPYYETEDGRAWLPDQWEHILMMDEEQHNATAAVCLFVGPDVLPIFHQVHLGRFSSALVLPSARVAHRYVYPKQAMSENIVGIVEELEIERLR